MWYEHKKIEKKWQKHWEENKTFKAEELSSKPKYYVLDMFPYPSGAGLHVGHLVGYTATDIIARYKRQKGYSVLHPMGWDSFGLPAEQYAVRTGTHPAETTKKNIENFRKQLKSLGFSYDWDREFATSEPSYYKWTQWIFTQLYKKGLAYQAEMDVNYCPALGTVLANEEVVEGKSVEGGHPVERRPLRQWILKITEYADRLIDDLELVDWPESIKKLQENWIGKSHGAKIDFPVPGIKEPISVFTTRPDTLFGATFVVLAPEHPIVAQITTKQMKPAVEQYQKNAAQKREIDRTDLAKEKTGVYTGGYAINPATGQEIPVWISDYVLMSYGTGAIMAVPTHDTRDFDFAKKHQLQVVAIFDPDFDSYPELLPEEVLPIEYREKVLSGEVCWTGEGLYINSSSGEISINGLDGETAKKNIVEWLEKKGLGEVTVNYKLRDWLFSRQRYWGEPFPILHFEDGTHRTLEIDELPLLPPVITDYKPTGDGRSPLAKVTEWVEYIDPKSGKKVRRETHTMPQWAGSCWYYLRFCDPHNEDQSWGVAKEKYWMNVDLYVGGVEHAVLHLLYARFWHKVLYDLGYVSTPEPFQTLRNQGLIVSRSYQRKSNRAYVLPEEVEERGGNYYHKETGEELLSQIEKMSKSKLNGVTPDEILDEFGADAIRLYEMFMGPLEKEKVWNTSAISGCYRFLKRFYEILNSPKLSDEEDEKATKLGHRLVDGVTRDIEALQFNTAIAKMMEFINNFTKLEKYPKSVVKMAIQCLSPFAPHIAEEGWEILKMETPLSTTPYPKVEQKYLEEDIVVYVIQINGKVRGKFELPKDQKEEVILEKAKEEPIIKRYLEGKEIIKVIFVPNRLLNIVIN